MKAAKRKTKNAQRKTALGKAGSFAFSAKEAKEIRKNFIPVTNLDHLALYLDGTKFSPESFDRFFDSNLRKKGAQAFNLKWIKTAGAKVDKLALSVQNDVQGYNVKDESDIIEDIQYLVTTYPAGFTEYYFEASQHNEDEYKNNDNANIDDMNNEIERQQANEDFEAGLKKTIKPKTRLKRVVKTVTKTVTKRKTVNKTKQAYTPELAILKRFFALHNKPVKVTQLTSLQSGLKTAIATGKNHLQLIKTINAKLSVAITKLQNANIGNIKKFEISKDLLAKVNAVVTAPKVKAVTLGGVKKKDNLAKYRTKAIAIKRKLSKRKKEDGLSAVAAELLKFPKGTTQAQKDLITSWAQGKDTKGLSGAYYSRNQSYSRSYNAEQAEGEGRFPLTRAAKYIGLSSAALKKGAEHADLVTTEWHLVGKYANKVDYWDVSKDGEIYNSYKFWFGAMTKSNKDWCMENLVRIAKQRLNENLKPKPLNTKKETRGGAIERRKKELKIYKDVNIPYNIPLDNKTLKTLKKEEQKKKHERKKQQNLSYEDNIKKRNRDAAKSKVRSKKYLEQKNYVLNNFKTLIKNDIDNGVKPSSMSAYYGILKDELNLTHNAMDAFFYAKIYEKMDKLKPIKAISTGQYTSDYKDYRFEI